MMKGFESQELKCHDAVGSLQDGPDDPIHAFVQSSLTWNRLTWVTSGTLRQRWCMISSARLQLLPCSLRPLPVRRQPVVL